MRIYFARAITGCSAKNVIGYYEDMSQTFSALGAEILHPMVGKGALFTVNKFRSTGYDEVPCSSNHSILQRDLWMVQQSDVVFCDLSHTDCVSIGCCMELAVAHWLRKHTIVIMKEGKNIHNHAFVLEAADVIFYNLQAAVDYLSKIIKTRKGTEVL
jgi:hypothetical protein